jgi:filamentous hemagglutinin family protein
MKFFNPLLPHVNLRKKYLSVVMFVASQVFSFASLAAPLTPNALPAGPNVTGGFVSINASGSTMNIRQTSQRAVIAWDSFNVGKNATVNFNQPSSSAATLNIVNGSAKTMINGAINSNGQIIFVNQNGVVFGKNAEINVGGMVATTMNADANKFMHGDGPLTFSSNGSGKVVKEPLNNSTFQV